MPATFEFPLNGFGFHPERPYQMFNSKGEFLGKKPKNPLAAALKTILGRTQLAIQPILPTGCPFVIGGGLIRDALGGARPGDIDIWLPSNITQEDCEQFVNYYHLVSGIPLEEIGIIFRGPDARGTRGYGTQDFQNVVEQAAYRDVSNHWVAEVNHPGYPKLNFMRSTVAWNGDSQEFFNGLMRCFDLDICMFFMGFEFNQFETPYMVVPLHIVNYLNNSYQGEHLIPRLNMLYWNSERWSLTDPARTQGRLDKMNAKYMFHLTAADIQLIPQDQIIACPIKTKRMVWGRNFIFPRPTLEYSIPAMEA